MRRSIAAATAAFFALWPFAGAADSYRDQSVEMEVDTSLDLTRYLGKWYEIARFPNRFETGCVGVTAEYAMRKDGRISVTNTCRKGALDGPVEQAEGVARVVAPGKLEVSFVPLLSFLPFIWGDYWVLYVDEGHDLAVIGTPKGRTGWILARAPRISEAGFARALEVLRDNGYDTGALERVAQPGG